MNVRFSAIASIIFPYNEEQEIKGLSFNDFSKKMELFVESFGRLKQENRERR